MLMSSDVQFGRQCASSFMTCVICCKQRSTNDSIVSPSNRTDTGPGHLQLPVQRGGHVRHDQQGHEARAL